MIPFESIRKQRESIVTEIFKEVEDAEEIKAAVDHRPVTWVGI